MLFDLVFEDSPIRPYAQVRTLVHPINCVAASDWSFHLGPHGSTLIKVQSQHCLVCSDPNFHFCPPLVELCSVSGVCARIVQSLDFSQYRTGQEAPLVKARLYLGHCSLSLCDLSLLSSDHLLQLRNFVTKTIDNCVPIGICSCKQGLAGLQVLSEWQGRREGRGLSPCMTSRA